MPGSQTLWLKQQWASVSEGAEALARRIDLRITVPLFILCIVYAHLYVSSPNTPSGPMSWEGWFDQSQYLKSAHALAEGDFSAGKHWYPIAYSLVATPFVLLGLRDPFLPINFVSFLLYCVLFVRYFRGVIGTELSVVALAVGLLLPLRIAVSGVADFPLLMQFIVPWNTTPVAALYMCVLLLIRDLDRNFNFWRDLALGAAAAAIVALRPMEAIPLVIAGAYYAYVRLVRGRRFRLAGAALGGAAAILLPVLLLTLAIHGTLATPYVEGSGDIGFGVSNILERAFAIFLGAGATFAEPHTAIFPNQPWLYLCAPLGVAWAAMDRRNGALPVGIVLAAFASYLAFNDFSPLNVFRYLLVHYILWTLPLCAAAGIAGFKILFLGKHWRIIAGCIAAALLLATLNLKASRITDATIEIAEDPQSNIRYDIGFPRRQSVDAVDLIGAAGSDWQALTLHRVEITLDGGKPLALFKGYRIFQTPHGVRILFNKEVAARSISIVVDPGIQNRPLAGDQVAAVAFTLGLTMIGQQSRNAYPH